MKNACVLIVAIASLVEMVFSDPKNRINVSFSTNGVSVLGGVIEWEYKALAFQLQSFKFNEVVFLNGDSPSEEYLVNSINIGQYQSIGCFRFGEFLGISYLSGNIRGEFIKDSANVMGAYSVYGTKHISHAAIPLKLSAGLSFKKFGIDVSPQLFWSGEKGLANAYFDFWYKFSL